MAHIPPEGQDDLVFVPWSDADRAADFGDLLGRPDDDDEPCALHGDPTCHRAACDPEEA